MKRRKQRHRPPDDLRVPQKPNGTRRLASVPEACAYGQFSRATLYRLIEAKRVKAYKLNRSTLVDLDSLDAMMNTLPEIKHA